MGTGMGVEMDVEMGAGMDVGMGVGVDVRMDVGMGVRIVSATIPAHHATKTYTPRTSH